MVGCLPLVPHWGSGLLPGHVSWPGMEPWAPGSEVEAQALSHASQARSSLADQKPKMGYTRWETESVPIDFEEQGECGFPPSSCWVYVINLHRFLGLSKPPAFEGCYFERHCSNTHDPGYFLDQNNDAVTDFDFCLSAVKMPFSTPVGTKWSCWLTFTRKINCLST